MSWGACTKFEEYSRLPTYQITSRRSANYASEDGNVPLIKRELRRSTNAAAVAGRAASCNRNGERFGDEYEAVRQKSLPVLHCKPGISDSEWISFSTKQNRDKTKNVRKIYTRILASAL